MKRLDQKRVWVWLVCMVVCSIFWLRADAATTLNYQGRLTVLGTNFTGTGHFKFVLVDAMGNGVWSNDGTPGAGEPLSAVPVEVNHGLFTVELGEGMNPIPPMVYHAAGLKLRTWFSHNGTAFEQLMPDVPVRSFGFDRLDTGRTIVVDSMGKGDFQNLQDAINHFAQYGGDGILVMPGNYLLSAPLTFPPTNTLGHPVDYPITGVGDRWRVWIQSSSGAAFRAGPFRLENLTVVGDPALTDETTGFPYWLRARNCVLLRNNPGGPTVHLKSEGMASFDQCDLENQKGGDVMRLEGNTAVEARDCSFFTQAGHGGALVLAGQMGMVRMERCMFNSQEEPGGPSVQITNTVEGMAEFVGCRFDRAVRIEAVGQAESVYGVRFRFCEMLQGLRVLSGWPHLELEQCRVEGRGGGVTALDLVALGLGAQVGLRDCVLMSWGAPGLGVRNARSGVTLKDSEVLVQEASALRVVADSQLGQEGAVRLDLEGCRVMNFSEIGSPHSTVVLESQHGSDPSRVGVSLVHSHVEGGGHGLVVSNAVVRLVRSGVRPKQLGVWGMNSWIEMAETWIEGGEDGMVVTNGEVSLSCSSVRGRRHGVVALGSCRVRARQSHIEAADEDAGSGDGIHFLPSADNEEGLHLERCTIDAYGSDPAQSRGIYAFYTNGTGFNLLSKNTIGASGAALQLSGGNYVLEGTLLHSLRGPVVLLMHSNTTASLTACNLYGMSEGNTNAALVLYATAGKMGPQPQMWNCTLQAYAPPFNAPFAISVSGGTSTGRVALVNSVLSTNINPVVAIVPVRTNLINGNIIP